MNYEIFETARLIARYLAGELTDDERARLDAWRGASEDRQQWFDRITEPKFAARKSHELRRFDTDAGWKDLSRQFHPRPHPRPLRRQWLYGALTTAAMVAGLIAFVYIPEKARPVIPETTIEAGGKRALLTLADGRHIDLEQRSGETVQEQDGTSIDVQADGFVYEQPADTTAAAPELYNRIAAPRGGECKLTLPDGSVVYLNAESDLRFPVRFSDSLRVVELNGESYFQIHHDETRPFIVRTAGIDITVLGTEFSVQSYPGSAEVLTTLASGSVAVSDEHLCRTLRPGEQAVYTPATGEMAVRQVDVDCYTAWKDGRFLFKNCTLEQILQTAARWYDIDVTYETDELRHIVFDCSIERCETVNEMLGLFQETRTVRFEIEGRLIRVLKPE